MKSLHAFLAAGIAVVGSITPAWADISVEEVFNFRNVRAPGSIGYSGIDQVLFGAANVVPNGADGTLGTFEQTIGPGQSVSGTLDSTPFPAFPNQFVASAPFQSGLLGSWDLTFTNPSQPSVHVTTPDLAGAATAPFADSITLSGAGRTPTFHWRLPAGFQPDSMEIQIWQYKSGPFSEVIVHSTPVPVGSTSYVVPDILSSGEQLAFNGRYAISINLYRNRPGETGSRELLTRIARAADFAVLASDPGAPVLLPAPVGPPEHPVFEFPSFQIIAGTPIAADPVMAYGYDFSVDSDDPRFGSVKLPGGLGDNHYQLYLLDGSGNTVLLDDSLLGDELYAFAPGGVQRFRVAGIETAGFDPTSPIAFVTLLTFAQDGEVTGLKMDPFAYAVPEPQTYWLILAGIAGLGLMLRVRPAPGLVAHPVSLGSS